MMTMAVGGDGCGGGFLDDGVVGVLAGQPLWAVRIFLAIFGRVTPARKAYGVSVVRQYNPRAFVNVWCVSKATE